MKILMMSKIFVHSGVASHIMDLSKNLQERGHSVWICSSNNENAEFCQRNNITFLKIDFSLSFLNFIKNVKKIREFINKNKIDIVHCHHRTCSFYMNIINFITKVPFVWTNQLNNIPSDFIHRKTTFYGKQAICVSSDLKKFCVEKLKIPEQRISIVCYGLPPERYQYDSEYVAEFRNRYDIGDKKIIGMLARIAPIKGHIHLINAISNIDKEKLNNCIIVFFGALLEDDYIEYLKSEIHSKNLEQYFIFEKFIKPEQALSLSDITVLPSLDEGFAIVSIESFFMKKLHIRTKTAGYSDMSDCCIGIEIGDEIQLKKELEKYLDGYDYTNLVNHAYDEAQVKFTINKMIESILDIYQKAIEC